MPLFCTLKSTYTGTKVPRIEKFSNNGYPLLFEPVNKHLFYANPDDKTVNKFYCAPLSKGNGRLLGKTIDVSAGGSFDAQISTSVRDHVIADNVATIEINKETSVTSTGSLSANQSLTWGSTVNIPISIKTGGTNGHALSLNTGTLTMPANPNTDNHKATHDFIIRTVVDPYVGKLYNINLSNTGSIGDGSEKTSSFTIIPGNNITLSNTPNSITIRATNTHTASHGASIDTTTANSPILQLTNNGSSGTYTTDLWTLTGLGATTVSSDIDNMFVYISSTDQKVKTISSTSTVYLSGKTVNTSSIGNEYVNSSVYMNNGSLYSKHFYATTPNTSSWGTSVAAALDIKGNDSGSQTPIFRVTSNTYGNCQLEYCEKWGIMRLYRNGKYTEFPNWNIDGKIPMSTIHDKNKVNTLINDIRVVSALPSNAASYPNTLFLVTG